MHWTQRGWQTRVDQCEGPVWFKSCAISASHLATAAKNPPRQFPAWKLPPVWPSNCRPIPRRPKSARPRGGVPLAGAAYTPQCEPTNCLWQHTLPQRPTATPPPTTHRHPDPQRPTATPAPATHRHPAPAIHRHPVPSDPLPPCPQLPTAPSDPTTPSDYRASLAGCMYGGGHPRVQPAARMQRACRHVLAHRPPPILVVLVRRLARTGLIPPSPCER